jgi:hypothetical protein
LAAFLCVFLCAWAAGEALTLFFIGSGIYSLATGAPMIGGKTAQLGASLGVGCFLAAWLAGWTFAGIAVIRELLRLVWAEDRLVLDRESLTHSRQLGPFRLTRRLARHEFRRVFVRKTLSRFSVGALDDVWRNPQIWNLLIQPSGSRPSTLMAQIGADVIALTDLGSQADHRDAADQLRIALRLAEASPSSWPAALPGDWQVVTDSSGGAVLVPNLQTRRKQALITSGIAVAVWTVAVLLAWQSLSRPGFWGITAMATAAATASGWAAIWLHRGRKEWRIVAGELVQRRRFGATVTDLLAVRALELTEFSDRVGYQWYQLNGIELSSPASSGDRADRIPERIGIDRAFRDPTEPRCLGKWLAEQAGLPFYDRVLTAADRQGPTGRGHVGI